MDDGQTLGRMISLFAITGLERQMYKQRQLSSLKDDSVTQ